MDATGWLLIAIIALYLVSFALFHLAWRRSHRSLSQTRDRAERAEDTLDKIRGFLDAEQAYEVMINDWGPEFTGENGTLPRWRWVVVDPMREAKILLGVPQSDATYLMLGNAETNIGALVAAQQWIEQQRHPVRIVEGADWEVLG